MAGLLVLGWVLLPRAFPLPEGLDEAPAPSPRLLDRSGADLAHVPRGDLFRHEPVTYAQIPRPLIDATLVAEDKRKILEFAHRYTLHSVNFDKPNSDPFFNINTPEDLSAAEEMAEKLLNE